MRLIDADALKGCACTVMEVGVADTYAPRSTFSAVPVRFIDEQPTVEVPRWIPVTERMPENTADVLVFRPKMKIEIGISCRINDEWLRYGKDLHGNDVITHWMPLPEPPEVE